MDLWPADLTICRNCGRDLCVPPLHVYKKAGQFGMPRQLHCPQTNLDEAMREFNPRRGRTARRSRAGSGCRVP